MTDYDLLSLATFLCAISLICYGVAIYHIRKVLMDHDKHLKALDSKVWRGW